MQPLQGDSLRPTSASIRATPIEIAPSPYGLPNENRPQAFMAWGRFSFALEFEGISRDVHTDLDLGHGDLGEQVVLRQVVLRFDVE